VPELSTGTVTFLFTDIEGSTRLWEEQTEAMHRDLAHHDALLRSAIDCARKTHCMGGRRTASQRSRAAWWALGASGAFTCTGLCTIDAAQDAKYTGGVSGSDRRPWKGEHDER
jgi:hypothetical protein